MTKETTKTYLFPRSGNAENIAARVQRALIGPRGSSMLPQAHITELTSQFDMASMPRLFITATNHEIVEQKIHSLTKAKIAVRNGHYEAPGLRAA